jgi:hypothetical protein
MWTTDSGGLTSDHDKQFRVLKSDSVFSCSLHGIITVDTACRDRKTLGHLWKLRHESGPGNLAGMSSLFPIARSGPPTRIVDNSRFTSPDKTCFLMLISRIRAADARFKTQTVQGYGKLARRFAQVTHFFVSVRKRLTVVAQKCRTFRSELRRDASPFPL